MRHDLRMGRPRVVVLNGGPSSGKTTIATAFRDQQAAVGDLWLIIGIDEFLAKLPQEWRRAGDVGGPHSADGLCFETIAGEPTITIGNVGRQLLRAYQASVAAAAREGLNVIVDEVIVDRVAWEEWQAALSGLDIVWVGVLCSPDVAETRNQLRGQHRYPGIAASLAVSVHRYTIYDLEVDTTARSAVEALADLNRGLGDWLDHAGT